MSRKPHKNYGQLRKNHTRGSHCYIIWSTKIPYSQGQRSSTGSQSLIDGGATHNFIDSSWVAKRGIQTKKFEGFTVAVDGNSSMECNY